MLRAHQKPVWITSVTTPDVSASFEVVRKALFSVFWEKTRELRFASGLQSLTLVAHLVNPSTGPLKEKTSYNGGLKTQFVSSNIDYRSWSTADWGQRVDLLTAAFERALSLVKVTRISDDEKTALKEALEQSRLEARARPPYD